MVTNWQWKTRIALIRERQRTQAWVDFWLFFALSTRTFDLSVSKESDVWWDQCQALSHLCVRRLIYSLVTLWMHKPTQNTCNTDRRACPRRRTAWVNRLAECNSPNEWQMDVIDLNAIRCYLGRWNNNQHVAMSQQWRHWLVITTARVASWVIALYKSC